MNEAIEQLRKRDQNLWSLARVVAEFWRETAEDQREALEGPMYFGFVGALDELTRYVIVETEAQELATKGDVPAIANVLRERYELRDQLHRLQVKASSATQNEVAEATARQLTQRERTTS